eukprot:TRINITY_DN9867_c0_g1_i1.p2 TRINITY_DN9867_c0_g1~~TRINITY_DN9867_c0_g1_i1.p2  ORF type:complete len:133 (+),score=26.99 TRINITY_DN9867_c0_g1_i1:254-652(+)
MTAPRHPGARVLATARWRLGTPLLSDLLLVVEEFASPVFGDRFAVVVKPWDGTIDMALLEQRVRAVTRFGFRWGVSRLRPVSFSGLKFLHIVAEVDPCLCDVYDVLDAVEGMEDCVQSTDIEQYAAQTKLAH